MANFSSCDLCFSPLNAHLVDVQISPATLVQISDDGEVVHRSRGLRDYRLCEGCGGFVREVLRAMTVGARGAA